MTFAGLCAIALAAAGASDPYEWPLDLPRLITSSFAEYRTGRFHAGIDLRTGGIGVPVKAPADGYVSRIRCSPYGYGKAVYVVLEDGNTCVYAHLDQFNEPLTEYIRREQHRRKSYRVELRPEAGALPVKRGEVIAYAGRTGIGVPHLHYELRDPGQRPFNPRLLGIDWPDATRPRIVNLLIAPEGPASRVNGGLEPVILTPRHRGGGRYVCEPVRVWGPVGFGADVQDPANGGANILGVHRLETRLDGEPVFHIQHDKVSYATLSTAAVAYHPYLLDQDRFLLQWRWPGNKTLSYARAESDGWLEAEPGEHVVALAATDFHGNEAQVEIPLSVGPGALEPPPAGVGEGRGSAQLRCYGDWLLVKAGFDAPEPEAPKLKVNGRAIEGGFFRIGPADFQAGYRPEAREETVVLSVAHPRMDAWSRKLYVFRRGGRTRTVRFGEAEVTVPSGAPYGTLFLSAGRGAPDAAGDIDPTVPLPFAAKQDVRGRVYRFWPEDAPLAEDVTLRIPAPEQGDASRIDLYRGRGGRWRWVRTRRTGGALVTEASRLGAFSAQEDSMPPLIRGVEPREGATLTERRPLIRGRIVEEGSTLAGVTATLDGAWLLVAYDPEEDSFAWERDVDLAPGEHTLRVTATDEAGNTGALERRFRIAPPN